VHQAMKQLDEEDLIKIMV